MCPQLYVSGVGARHLRHRHCRAGEAGNEHEDHDDVTHSEHAHTAVESGWVVARVCTESATCARHELGSKGT
jgi:hypothetical protein